MSHSSESKWNKIYSQRAEAEVSPCLMLKRYSYLLPKKGRALDLASGLGGNARFLAQLGGLEVSAWDISEVAVEALNDWARKKQLPLKAITRDVEANPPESSSFDVLVVSNFLHRSTLHHLCQALKPGGCIVYQTHTQERPQGSSGPSNPDYLLTPNELLSAFSGLRILAFHDEGLCGDTTQGLRGLSGIVAVRV